MHAFHFGSSGRRLFGVYHGAEQARVPSVGAVLCQPFGHEYIRTHRALRQMAAQLAASGIHVLRFDYYGCGDSAGDGEEGSIAQWVSDVHAAVDELKDTADVRRVSLVGVRLGATLAALAAAARDDVDTLLLWDPVQSGVDYVDRQRDLQARWLATRPWIASAAGAPDRELIGFPLTRALEHELVGLDLLGVERWPARATTVLSSREIDVAPLASHLRACGATAGVVGLELDCDWDRAAAVHLVLLAQGIVQRACELLTADGAA